MERVDARAIAAHSPPMLSVADIFSVLGGPAAVARALGVRASTASEMKRRGSIPAEYWQDLILAARRSGASTVTAEALVTAHRRVAGSKRTDVPHAEVPAASRPRSTQDLGAAFEAPLREAPQDEESREIAPAGQAWGQPAERPAGHFSRFYHLSRPHFGTAEAVRDHVSALRDEWAHR